MAARLLPRPGLEILDHAPAAVTGRARADGGGNTRADEEGEAEGEAADDAAARIMEELGSAISLAAAVTLAASLFVLAAAIAAQTHRRRYDAVVLKVLGATRRDIAKSFIIEYGLLGIAASVLALLLGHVAAWGLVTYLLEMMWGFDIGIAVAIVVGGTIAAMVLGFLGTWRVLGTRPAPYLRNE